MAEVLMYGWDTGTGEWVKIEVTDEGKLEISPITFPDDYPLPAAQVADLRDVDIGNFPATYPLSDAQIALLQAVTVGNWPADPSTGGRQDVQTDLISLIRSLLAARLPTTLDTGHLRVREQNWPATYPLSDAQIALLQAVTVGNWPADPSTGGRQDVQTDLISLIRSLLAARLPTTLDTGHLRVREQNWPATYPLSDAQVASLRSETFGGNVFRANATMPDNEKYSLSAVEKKLRDMVLIVTGHPLLLGDITNQTYPVGVGETLGFTKVDISTLWFRNAVADSNGTVNLIGVEE